MKNEVDLTKRFLDTCHALSELNLEVGSSGNLSLRNGNQVLITPSGMDYHEISSPDISLVDINTLQPIKGAKPSSDAVAHIDIYEAREDIIAIVHTHSHYITLAAMMGEDIPVLNTMHADYFSRPIQCTPFSNHRKTGFGSARYFSEGNIFLLVNHGGLVLITENQFDNISSILFAFSEVCRLYCKFMLYANGSNSLLEARTIPASEVEDIHQYYQTQYGKR